jgi:hypothetical protein
LGSSLTTKNNNFKITLLSNDKKKSNVAERDKVDNISEISSIILQNLKTKNIIYPHALRQTFWHWTTKFNTDAFCIGTGNRVHGDSS